MARIVGYGGSVIMATVSTPGIKTWSIDYKVAPLESTAFDSAGVAAYLTGISSWSGSFDGFKDGVPLTLAATTACVFRESAASNWAGSIIVTGIKPKTDSHGLIAYSYDFQGTGTLTPAAA